MTNGHHFDKDVLFLRYARKRSKDRSKPAPIPSSYNVTEGKLLAGIQHFCVGRFGQVEP